MGLCLALPRGYVPQIPGIPLFKVIYVYIHIYIYIYIYDMQILFALDISS